MACGSCGGGAPRYTVTPDGKVTAPPGSGPFYRVILPNGAQLDARDEWDAVQKQAMYGGAVEEINPVE